MSGLQALYLSANELNGRHAPSAEQEFAQGSRRSPKRRALVQIAGGGVLVRLLMLFN